MLFLSPILGGPEFVVPIGQSEYHSRVSQRKELLPIGVSLLAAPGEDLALLELAETCLEQSHRPTQVAAGGNMFAT